MAEREKKVLTAAHAQKLSKYLVWALLGYSKTPSQIFGTSKHLWKCAQTQETLICEHCWETHYTFLPEWAKCQSKTCPQGRVAGTMCVKQVVEQGWCTQDPTKHLVGRKIHYLTHCLLLRRKATGLQAGLSKKWRKKKKKKDNKQTETPHGLSAASALGLTLS